MTGWKRAKADLINFQKELQRREKEFVKFANLSLILELIPIFENFKEAFRHCPQNKEVENWIQGVEQIKKQFKNLLNRLGVKEIFPLGEKFDLERDEVIGKRREKGKKEGEIVEVIKPAYSLDEKIIVPSKVIIAE